MSDDAFKTYAVMTAARSTRLSPSERLVLSFMALRANSTTGLCWASQSTIAEDTGLSERQVRTAMADLRDRGVIVKVPANHPSDTYRFDVDALERSKGAPDKGERGGARVRRNRCEPIPEPDAANTAPAISAPAKTAGTGKDCLPDRQRLPDPPAKTAANLSIDLSNDQSIEKENARPTRTEIPSFIDHADELNACAAIQQQWAERHGVPLLLSPEDQQAIRKRCKRGAALTDFVLLGAWFLESDEFQPTQSRADGWLRWKTICNDGFDERVRLARAWNARGRTSAGPPARAAPSRDRPSKPSFLDQLRAIPDE